MATQPRHARGGQRREAPLLRQPRTMRTLRGVIKKGQYGKVMPGRVYDILRREFPDERDDAVLLWAYLLKCQQVTSIYHPCVTRLVEAFPSVFVEALASSPRYIYLSPRACRSVLAVDGMREAVKNMATGGHQDIALKYIQNLQHDTRTIEAFFSTKGFTQ